MPLNITDEGLQKLQDTDPDARAEFFGTLSPEDSDALLGAVHKWKAGQAAARAQPASPLSSSVPQDDANPLANLAPPGATPGIDLSPSPTSVPNIQSRPPPEQRMSVGEPADIQVPEAQQGLSDYSDTPFPQKFDSPFVSPQAQQQNRLKSQRDDATKTALREGGKYPGLDLVNGPLDALQYGAEKLQQHVGAPLVNNVLNPMSRGADVLHVPGRETAELMTRTALGLITGPQLAANMDPQAKLKAVNQMVDAANALGYYQSFMGLPKSVSDWTRNNAAPYAQSLAEQVGQLPLMMTGAGLQDEVAASVVPALIKSRPMLKMAAQSPNMAMLGLKLSMATGKVLGGAVEGGAMGAAMEAVRPGGDPLEGAKMGAFMGGAVTGLHEAPGLTKAGVNAVADTRPVKAAVGAAKQFGIKVIATKDAMLGLAREVANAHLHQDVPVLDGAMQFIEQPPLAPPAYSPEMEADIARDRAAAAEPTPPPSDIAATPPEGSNLFGASNTGVGLPKNPIMAVPTMRDGKPVVRFVEHAGDGLMDYTDVPIDSDFNARLVGSLLQDHGLRLTGDSLLPWFQAVDDANGGMFTGGLLTRPNAQRDTVWRQVETAQNNGDEVVWHGKGDATVADRPGRKVVTTPGGNRITLISDPAEKTEGVAFMQSEDGTAKAVAIPAQPAPPSNLPAPGDLVFVLGKDGTKSVGIFSGPGKKPGNVKVKVDGVYYQRKATAVVSATEQEIGRHIIEQHEERIRREPIEHRVIVDSRGNVMRNNTDNMVEGVSNGLNTLAEMRADGGTIYTHNHPPKVAKGYGFSPADYIVPILGNAAEMRAKTPDGTVYVLKRPEGGWPFQAEAEKGVAEKNLVPAKKAINDLIQPVWQDAVAAARKYLYEHPNSPQSEAEAFGQNQFHEAMQKLGEKYGWKLERIEPEGGPKNMDLTAQMSVEDEVQQRVKDAERRIQEQMQQQEHAKDIKEGGDAVDDALLNAAKGSHLTVGMVQGATGMQRGEALQWLTEAEHAGYLVREGNKWYDFKDIESLKQKAQERGQTMPDNPDVYDPTSGSIDDDEVERMVQESNKKLGNKTGDEPAPKKKVEPTPAASPDEEQLIKDRALRDSLSPQEREQRLRDAGYTEDEIRRGFYKLTALRGHAWMGGDVVPITDEVMQKQMEYLKKRRAETADLHQKIDAHDPKQPWSLVFGDDTRVRNADEAHYLANSMLGETELQTNRYYRQNKILNQHEAGGANAKVESLLPKEEPPDDHELSKGPPGGVPELPERPQFEGTMPLSVLEHAVDNIAKGVQLNIQRKDGMWKSVYKRTIEALVPPNMRGDLYEPWRNAEKGKGYGGDANYTVDKVRAARNFFHPEEYRADMEKRFGTKPWTEFDKDLADVAEGRMTFNQLRQKHGAMATEVENFGRNVIDEIALNSVKIASLGGISQQLVDMREEGLIEPYLARIYKAFMWKPGEWAKHVAANEMWRIDNAAKFLAEQEWRTRFGKRGTPDTEKALLKRQIDISNDLLRMLGEEKLGAAISKSEILKPVKHLMSRVDTMPKPLADLMGVEESGVLRMSQTLAAQKAIIANLEAWKAVAENPALSSKLRDDTKGHWNQIPDSKMKYGLSAGRWVDDNLHRALINMPDQLGNIERALKTFFSPVKTAKVTYGGTKLYLQNAMSNIAYSIYAGGLDMARPVESGDAFGMALKTLFGTSALDNLGKPDAHRMFKLKSATNPTATNDAATLRGMLDLARACGVDMPGIYGTELGGPGSTKLINEYKKNLLGAGDNLTLHDHLEIIRRTAEGWGLETHEGLRHFYDLIDRTFKLANFYSLHQRFLREFNGDVDAAARQASRQVNMAFPNPSMMAGYQKALSNIPGVAGVFAGFATENVRVHLSLPLLMQKDPQLRFRMVAGALAMYGMQQGIREWGRLNGIGDAECDEAIKLQTDEHRAFRPMVMCMPWRENGHAWAIDFSQWMPFSEFMKGHPDSTMIGNMLNNTALAGFKGGLLGDASDAVMDKMGLAKPVNNPEIRTRPYAQDVGKFIRSMISKNTSTKQTLDAGWNAVKSTAGALGSYVIPGQVQSVYNSVERQPRDERMTQTALIPNRKKTQEKLSPTQAVLNATVAPVVSNQPPWMTDQNKEPGYPNSPEAVSNAMQVKGAKKLFKSDVKAMATDTNLRGMSREDRKVAVDDIRDVDLTGVVARQKERAKASAAAHREYASKKK